MTPEFLDLLRAWGPGFFWIIVILIWSIKEIIVSHNIKKSKD